MVEIDLSKLLGGQGFHVDSQLAYNGLSFTVNTLADTGANGYLFIDTKKAIELARFYNIPTEPLKQPAKTRGFSGSDGPRITHAIKLHLIVGGRRFLNQTFLILNLGQHEAIIGRRWFAEHDVWLDVRNRRLIWPYEQTLKDELEASQPEILPKQILQRPRPRLEHQKDADRRDQKMNQEDQQIERYRPPRSEDMDRRSNMWKMGRALNEKMIGQTREEHSVHERNTPDATLDRSYCQTMKSPVDIALIGSAPFERHMKRKNTEVFITSLYEIDRTIEDKRLEERQAEEMAEQELIQQRLPQQYKEYSDVFSKAASDELPPHRSNDYQIHLEDGTHPEQTIGHSPLYKQSREELEAAREYVIDNLSKGFIGPSAAPYTSPILMARKPGGGLRFCVDYRKLNSITRKDRYPIPLVDELMERLSDAKVYTKLDIRQGFHRIRLDPDSSDLTTFRTRYGTYKYNVLPFGLTNGPAAFQRFINDTLGMDYLDNFVTAFVDDLIIYSKNETEHEKHVKMVLERLRAAGLQASIKKCEFHVTRTKYLGFILTTEGIEVDPEKTQVIHDWKVPNTVRGVQSFLGFCNFYRRFIKDYSRVARPLNQLTKREVPFVWDDKCQEAFKELK